MATLGMATRKYGIQCHFLSGNVHCYNYFFFIVYCDFLPFQRRSHCSFGHCRTSTSLLGEENSIHAKMIQQCVTPNSTLQCCRRSSVEPHDHSFANLYIYIYIYVHFRRYICIPLISKVLGIQSMGSAHPSPSPPSDLKISIKVCGCYSVCFSCSPTSTNYIYASELVLYQ